MESASTNYFDCTELPHSAVKVGSGYSYLLVAVHTVTLIEPITAMAIPIVRSY